MQIFYFFLIKPATDAGLFQNVSLTDVMSPAMCRFLLLPLC